jgi:hypothetical protein
MAAKDEEPIDDREMEEGEPLTAEDEKILDEVWAEELDDEELDDLSDEEINDMIG